MNSKLNKLLWIPRAMILMNVLFIVYQAFLYSSSAGLKLAMLSLILSIVFFIFSFKAPKQVGIFILVFLFLVLIKDSYTMVHFKLPFHFINYAYYLFHAVLACLLILLPRFFRSKDKIEKILLGEIKMDSRLNKLLWIPRAMIIIHALYTIFNFISNILQSKTAFQYKDPSQFKTFLIFYIVSLMISFAILTLSFVFSFKAPVQVGNFLMILLLIKLIFLFIINLFDIDHHFNLINLIFDIYYFLTAFQLMIFPRIFKSKVEIEDKTS